MKNIFPLTVHLWYEFSKFRFDIRYIDEELGLKFYEITSKEEYLCHQYPNLYYKIINDLFTHPYFIIMNLYIRSEKLCLHELRTYLSFTEYKSEYSSVNITPHIFPQSRLHSVSLKLLEEILLKTPKDKDKKEKYLIKFCQSIHDFYDDKVNQNLIKKAFWLYDEGEEARDEYSKIYDKIDNNFLIHQKKFL